MSIDHELGSAIADVTDIATRLRQRLDRNSTRSSHLAAEAAETARDALRNAREWVRIDMKQRGVGQ